MMELVIGYGEVGKSLAEILSERYEVGIHDPQKGLNWTPAQVEANGGCEWMHVCFPHGPRFESDVQDYVAQFKPKHVVIHSTVTIGTTRCLQQEMDRYPRHNTFLTYSPIRGIHPHLTRYLREFPKWFATYDSYEEIERHLVACGMQVRGAPSTEVLELMKLLETTEYGYRIALWQEIERQLERMQAERGLAGSWDENLTAVKEWLFEKRKVYDGDRGLAPIMYGGVIGGHCVMPNIDLLRESGFLSPQLYRWLTESNEMRKEELVDDR